MNAIDCSVLRTAAWAAPISALLASVCACLEQFQNSGEDNAGHLEQALKKSSGNFVAAVLEKALQAKANSIPPHCPRCGAKLTKGQKLTRTIHVVAGEIQLTRLRGYCPKCQDWFCPADEALGIQSGHSPCVQELAALFASKMPLADAAAVMEIATGLKMPLTTLDRVAKRAAQNAQIKRRQLDEQAGAVPWPGEPPQTLIIQVDAWNIRERDHWGQSDELRLGGVEPERWHWVYTGTVFALEHRLCKEGRAIISSRGFVATRLGLDELREQLWGEAMRRGLGQARRLILIADGAPWIWALGEDRFPEALQRVDFYHVQEHLWAVAHELYPQPEQAKAWMEKIKGQLREGQALKIIGHLEEALRQLPQGSRTAREIKYLKEHQERMDYGVARARGEPIGSGAIEATCRQYQCRFKRPGQFWSTTGDEGLLCLETFWRNGRWKLLFPHSPGFDPSKN
jgi:hypothetical protein